MMKLLIADDEKAIRETISSLIDWRSLNVELVGTAKDGIEAYNIILDLYPDIVLTDIRMPGLSGLDLIQKMHEINKDTQFIILSGYHEFEYAKTAMQYGVKHYLLKPCNEEQIIESIKEIQEDFNKRKITEHIVEEHFLQKRQIHSSLMISMINHYLTRVPCDTHPQEGSWFRDYRMYFGNPDTPQDVYYLYFVEENYYMQAFQDIYTFWELHYPDVLLNLLYVHNTLLFFFQSFASAYPELEEFLESLRFEGSCTTPMLRHTVFPELLSAILKLCTQLGRYERICYSGGQSVTVISNSNNILRNIQDEISRLFDPSLSSGKGLDTLKDMILHIYDLDSLRQITPSCIIAAVSRLPFHSIADAITFLMDLEQESDVTLYKSRLLTQIETLYEQSRLSPSTGEISDRIRQYVNEHISDPELSLKHIAENELYMNVDYLSKKFIRETGMKFSSYLTNVRIQKAKELMSAANPDTIQNIAEMVGCGNNPQYFSQIFKKATGKSPSQYMKLIHR